MKKYIDISIDWVNWLDRHYGGDSTGCYLYSINSDNSVDFRVEFVLDSLFRPFYNKSNNVDDLDVISELPFKIGRVNGWFDCRGVGLISLKNCPDYVDGNIYTDVVDRNLLSCTFSDLYYNDVCYNHIGICELLYSLGEISREECFMHML